MSSTKEKLIDSAMKHLYQLGYNRFSFAPVAKECGIAKASIHYHFPDKDSLVLAAIEKYITNQKHFLENIKQDQSLIAPEKFNAIFDHAYEQMINMNYIGCLAGNLGLEISETNPRVLEYIQAFLEYKEKLMAEILKEGQLQGSIKNDIDINKTALNILTSIEGGIITSKISKNAKLLANALSVCRKIVSEITC
ncbi:MAG: TetR/AcrR family transcriptional regulator [Gammaproteobacteria bacterium]|nr:TetR/AcrR family transcriptional regulator [Gammaproteobacteria bacterium]MDH5613977.1 TetR/AcrR family transcriptional regulator [Gammaproteobacteria bacterium]